MTYRMHNLRELCAAPNSIDSSQDSNHLQLIREYLMKNGFSNGLILYNSNLFTSRSNFNKHIHSKSRPNFTKLIQALSQMWNNCDRSIVKSGVFSMIIINVIKHPLIQIFKSNRWKACAAQQHTYGKSPKNRPPPEIKFHRME